MYQENSLDPQLWQACAGSLVPIPSVNSKVFYFAQGHAEHAHAPPDFHAPRVPPLILCRVVAVKLLADTETDEAYTKITLLPLPIDDLDGAWGLNLSDGNNGNKGTSSYFVQTLTQTDVSSSGGFLLRNHAETIFPRFPYPANVWVQTVFAKDIHGETWKFDLSYRGNPRGHFLTTGWNTFVFHKKLIAGDSIIFFTSESGELYFGLRRAKQGRLNAAGKEIRLESVVASAARGDEFEVVYYPRAGTPEFCVNAANVRSAMRISWCSGMRFRMAFETKDSNEISWCMGTVSGVQVADPIRWSNSPWRLLQVVWDDLAKINFNSNSIFHDYSLQNVKRVNPWLVELVMNMPAIDNSDSIEVSSLASDEGEGITMTGTEKSHNKQLQDNPFHSVAVTSYLRAAKEMTRETECILVFTCGDNNDVDETFFIETISKKLQEREVTPLTYNLSGRDKLDVEMLDRSSVGIVVLSNSYTFSNQSLDHLMEILGHGKEENLVTIPICFKVTLSDVCGLEGKFEAAYLQQPDKVQKWKAAMAAIVSMDVHEWKKETEVMLAEEVVRSACLSLYLKSSKNLVRILALLNDNDPSDTDIVGIWGMAGIGKTSIAREIFGTLAPQYDLCYFLQDFHQMCQKKGLKQMRDDFYSKLFGEEKLSICASDVKPSFMRDWFQRKKILVVLDDVSNARDAEAVVGGFSWFSRGHRIILTSRRKQVLVQCKVKEAYEIQKLCEFESLSICKNYLNGENVVISELMRCSSGIPLALKILGSSVAKQHTDNMKEHLDSLRRNPPTQIKEAFQRSFDELDENEKNIFLDLACFFRGENKDYVVQLLDACGFSTYLGICDLVDESLISLVDNRIEMAVPFQDMGRFIVNEEDEDPCERSRLWDSNNIVDVLTNNSGTDATEGIFLDMFDLTCVLSPTVFDKMYRLRLLKFHSSNDCKLSLPQGLDTLPDELRLLHWEDYPLECLPQNFNPENLVELNMPYSNMERLWQGKKNLEKLKKIRLSHSKKLTDIMMLSEALNLEHIDLEGCTSLRRLPVMVDLISLKLLDLSGCSELQDIHDFAPNLRELYLAWTPIIKLPLTINNLAKLVTLDLEHCRNLQELPSGIHNSRSIVDLYLTGCINLPQESMEALNSQSMSLKRKR